MATLLPFPPRPRAVPAAPAARPAAPASSFADAGATVGAGRDADRQAAELLLDLEELPDGQRMAVACALLARVAAELAIGQRRPAGDARLTVLHRMSSTAERAAELAERHATPAWPDGAA